MISPGVTHDMQVLSMRACSRLRKRGYRVELRPVVDLAETRIGVVLTHDRFQYVVYWHPMLMPTLDELVALFTEALEHNGIAPLKLVRADA